MTPAELRERFRALDSLSHFDDVAVTMLAGCAKDLELADGESLFGGEPSPDEVFVILDGIIEIARTTRYGPVALETLGPGDLVGEVAYVDGQGRTGDATSTGTTRLARLERSALESIANEDQRFLLGLHWALWRSLSSKLRATNERLAGFFGSRTPLPDDVTMTASGREAPSVNLEDKQALFREQKLSPMEIGFLASLSHEERFEEGEAIFRDGEEAVKLYVVLDGTVMISKNIAGAGEEALAFLERGDYFGEMALFDGAPRSAEASAHTGGATVLSLDRDVVGGILDYEKVSSIRLLEILSRLAAKRLRDIDEKLIGWHLLDRATTGH